MELVAMRQDGQRINTFVASCISCCLLHYSCGPFAAVRVSHICREACRNPWNYNVMRLGWDLILETCQLAIIMAHTCMDRGGYRVLPGVYFSRMHIRSAGFIFTITRLLMTVFLCSFGHLPHI